MSNRRITIDDIAPLDWDEITKDYIDEYKDKGNKVEKFDLKAYIDKHGGGHIPIKNLDHFEHVYKVLTDNGFKWDSCIETDVKGFPKELKKPRKRDKPIEDFYCIDIYDKDCGYMLGTESFECSGYNEDISHLECFKVVECEYIKAMENNNTDRGYIKIDSVPHLRHVCAILEDRGYNIYFNKDDADIGFVHINNKTYAGWNYSCHEIDSSDGIDLSEYFKLYEEPEEKKVEKVAEKEVPIMGKSKAAAIEQALKILADIEDDNGGMTEEKVVELIKKHLIPKEIKVKINDKEPKKIDGLVHKQFEEILKAVSCKTNVMLVGPAGSGKTTTAKQVAEALDLPFHFNGALSSEYKLTGFMDANGKLVRTAFREAYENGGVYLFDEIDASMPDALLAFNAALANGVADFPDSQVKKHDNFYCIAAANTYGKGADRVYVGRSQLDGASLDRFAIFNFEYDEKMERILAGNDEWCDYIQKTRKVVESKKIRHVVSPRASIEGSKLLAAGLKKELVEDIVLWKGLDKDTQAKIQKELGK